MVPVEKDATIIAAPASTKNPTGSRDPATHQTKKSRQWYVGMTAHIGVDVDVGYQGVERRSEVVDDERLSRVEWRVVARKGVLSADQTPRGNQRFPRSFPESIGASRDAVHSSGQTLIFAIPRAPDSLGWLGYRYRSTVDRTLSVRVWPGFSLWRKASHGSV